MKHITTLLLLLLSVRWLPAEELLLKDVTFVKETDVITINYNLPAEAERPYKVTLILTSPKDPNYKYKPKSITGDFGKVAPGSNKEIKWAYKNEFPQGLKEDAIVFSISANNNKSNMLYYLIGGGAVLVGGVIYFAIQSGNEPDASTGTIAIDVPGDM